MDPYMYIYFFYIFKYDISKSLKTSLLIFFVYNKKIMLKDSIILQEIKLVGLSNFHIQNYMITYITISKRLQFIFFLPSLSTSFKKKEIKYSKNLKIKSSKDKKFKKLIYIMNIVIKSSLLIILSDFYEPKKVVELLTRIL